MDLKIQKKFETEKGKPCILVDGHKYREFNVLSAVKIIGAGGAEHWGPLSRRAHSG